jgi:hypothetical protein
MPKLIVPAPADVVKKWTEETPRRSAYYQKEAPAAAERQNANAIAAAPLYKSAVTAPDIDKRFAGGLKKAGPDKFRRKVESVGVARFGPGVTAAKDDYDKGVTPYLEELTKIEVPERKPRGDEANIDRVRKIAVELHKKRLAVLAAGP